MYLERRRARGRVRYYLGHSFREGGRVRKIRHYLGADLSDAALREKKARAERRILDEIRDYKAIQDPLQGELSAEELAAIRRLETGIDVSHLSDKDWKAFSELFTYNTNAIEGSELNSKEVRKMLEEDAWPLDSSKGDIAEAYGVNDAILVIRRTKEHLSLGLICGIHRIVFRNSKAFAGRLRRPGEEVVVMGADGRVVHRGAPQDRVVALLKGLVDWYGKHKSRYPGIVLAAVVHNQFENIHPFRDGNGRVGRILLNNILLKHGLPPVNIDLKNRAEYYAALQAYEHGHDIMPTLKLIIKEYKALRKILGK